MVRGTHHLLLTECLQALNNPIIRLDNASDVQAEVIAIVKDTVAAHKRIIFNGNNYSEAWVEEAERRGLPNLRTSVDAIPTFSSEKSISLFEKHGIFTAT